MYVAETLKLNIFGFYTDGQIKQVICIHHLGKIIMRILHNFVMFYKQNDESIIQENNL